MKFLNKTLLAAAATAALTTLGAHANTVNGTIWENFPTYTGNENANFAAVTTMEGEGAVPQVTFTAPAPLDFNSDDTGNGYTIGGFLATGNGSGNVVYKDGAASSDTMDNTLFNFTGSVTVTNGETFDIEHDDGVEFQINGVTVVDEEGPTAATFTPYTWNGSSGTYSFQLTYAEVEGPPAVLDVQLPLSGGSALPDAGMTVGLLGASLTALAVFRRKLGFNF